MDYQKIHDQIIKRAKSENRQRDADVYYEQHHIIPRCLNGTNDSENLVLLTAREHFIVHWLLHRIYPSNHFISYAFHAMSNLPGSSKRRKYKPSSRVFEEAKTAFSTAHSARMSNTTQSTDHINKRMKSRRGKKTIVHFDTNEIKYVDETELQYWIDRGWENTNWTKGRQVSDTTRKKQSINATKRQIGKVGEQARASKGPYTVEFENGMKITKGSFPELSKASGIKYGILQYRKSNNIDKFMKGWRIY